MRLVRRKGAVGDGASSAGIRQYAGVEGSQESIIMVALKANGDMLHIYGSPIHFVGEVIIAELLEEKQFKWLLEESTLLRRNGYSFVPGGIIHSCPYSPDLPISNLQHFLLDLEIAGKLTLYREEMEAYDESKKNCLLIHEKFCKFFPPSVAGSISHLTDQETYLEDSSGLRWKMTVCNHNGSLAIRQGWSEFSSEHAVVKRLHLAVTLAKEKKERGLEETTPVEKSKEASQCGEDGNGNEKVIKNNPSGSGVAPSCNAVNYSCVVEVDG
ncbi:hypothetical protein T459_10082 [Capsicum annuum]|uniref:Uncharacterized protein n=1 Tax=Capsicum annuum TaxID=4072 RepID=A0A2G3A198_CAPAN|nr:hypothetical protein T459_10082 [Capsicum annuum]